MFAWLLAIVNAIITHFYVMETYLGYREADVPKNLDKVKIAKVSDQHLRCFAYPEHQTQYLRCLAYDQTHRLHIPSVDAHRAKH